MSHSKPRKVTIHERSGKMVFTVGNAVYCERSKAFRGEIVISAATTELANLLQDLDDRISGNSLAYVDEVQDLVDAFDLLATFEDGAVLEVADLFVGSKGGISFRKRGDAIGWG